MKPDPKLSPFGVEYGEFVDKHKSAIGKANYRLKCECDACYTPEEIDRRPTMKPRTYWVVTDYAERPLSYTVAISQPASIAAAEGPCTWLELIARGFTVRRCRIELVPEEKR